MKRAGVHEHEAVSMHKTEKSRKRDKKDSVVKARLF